VATILIISSIVKRLLSRASPLAGGIFYLGGLPPIGAGAAYPVSYRFQESCSIGQIFAVDRGVTL